MKYKKQKLIISALIFLVGLWMNIYFSTNLHFLLTKKMEVLSFIPIKDCIISMVTSKGHLLLFLCLQGFNLLFSVFYYIANHKPYQSDLIEVTPQISTPVSAGQKQFGSAKWLTDKEKDVAFESFILNGNDDGFHPLLNANKEELEKINQEERMNSNEKEQEKNSTLGESKEKQTTNESKHELEDAKKQDYQKKHQLPKIKSGGIVIGCKQTGSNEKIYYIDEDTHTLCIGATRSGKTRTVVLQSIGTIGLAGESMILSDPKGELYTYTYPFLKNMGYKVICLEYNFSRQKGQKIKKMP